MSNNTKPCVEQTIQQAIDECTESIQAAFEEFNNWLKSEREARTTSPLNHHEDSSDECASIGSPMLANDRHDIICVNDYTFDHANIHSIGQDLYKTNNQNKECNNQSLFPALSDKINNMPTIHCDTKVRSYKLPEIAFTGCICTSTIQKTQLSVPEIVNEGLLVDKFLDDFESHIKQSNLNIENHWYGLMEISFKCARDKHIELYLWFKRRLYEGLTWSGAQAIIKHQLGFYSCTSKNTISEALTKYRQGPQESFEGFYYRFKSYVAACNALMLYPGYVLICQFISSVNIAVQKYMMECLINHPSFKTKVKSSLPSEENNLLLHEIFNVLKEIHFSWGEFDNAILSANFQNLCAIRKKKAHKINKRQRRQNYMKNRNTLVVQEKIQSNLHKSS